jgi:hypothetical protein
MLLSAAAWPAFGMPITFTYTGSGSGALNGISFGDTAPVAFTITATGDTDHRQTFGSGLTTGFFIEHESLTPTAPTASISITGLGIFDFVTDSRTFVNNSNNASNGVIGFSRVASQSDPGSDLFNGPPNAVPGIWDMLTDIGPIKGTGRLLQWSSTFPDVVTTGGVLEFNTNESTPWTFQAIVGSVPEPVPEPGTLALLGLALAAAAWARARSPA